MRFYSCNCNERLVIIRFYHTYLIISVTHYTNIMLRCKDCPHWYGGEDFGYGSCRLKLQRSDKKFLTFGQQDCDEGLLDD
jgi:hypothetical protein